MIAPKVENQEYIEAAYALTLIEGIGKRKAYRIWMEEDLKEEYLFAFTSNFKKKPAWASKLTSMALCAAKSEAQIIIQENTDHKCQALLIGDAYYPSTLVHIPDAPLVLFAKGDKLSYNAKNISIVGTRSPTDYGRQNAALSAKYFAENGINVISGFAHGIDIEAHKSAVQEGGTTTAILGSGLGCIYPKENSKYVNSILENGCFLSELPYLAKPDKMNFPERNRLVAAMGKATLVVESKSKGGSLITAKLAFDYNREVFVYPGEIDNENYTGNHALIQYQMAQLATSPNYILKQLGWHAIGEEHKPTKDVQVADHLDALYKSILNHKKCDIHFLSELLKEPIYSLQLKITELELMGVIRSFPGNSYAAN